MFLGLPIHGAKLFFRNIVPSYIPLGLCKSIWKSQSYNILQILNIIELLNFNTIPPYPLSKEKEFPSRKLLFWYDILFKRHKSALQKSKNQSIIFIFWHSSVKFINIILHCNKYIYIYICICIYITLLILISILFSCSVMSYSLPPHGLQDTRLPWPSPTPGAYSNPCPSNWWCHPTISFSVDPFSSCLQSFPASRSFPIKSESVLRIRWPEYWSFSFRISPSNEYSELISFRSDWLDLHAVQGTLKSLLQHHSSKASIFGTQLSLWSNSHIHTWLLEKP